MKKLSSVFVLGIVILTAGRAQVINSLKVDFEYAPKWWQTAIGLPDDHLKTVVGKEGQFFYDFVRIMGQVDPGPFRDFRTVIALKTPENSRWTDQHLLSPKIPIIETFIESGNLGIKQTAFSVAPPFIDKLDAEDHQFLGVKARTDYDYRDSILGAPRNDINIISYSNNGEQELTFSPVIKIKSSYPVTAIKENNRVEIGGHLAVKTTHNIRNTLISESVINVHQVDVTVYLLTLYLDEVTLGPGREFSFSFGINAGNDALIVPNSVAQADMLKRRSAEYWEGLDLPYNHMMVPDPGIQDIIYSSVRNIFQAREIKNNLPSFQVGPTVYRGLWVVDGAFLLESMTFLGEIQDVRNGIEYLMDFQNEDGSFEMIKQHWKETGIVLWAVTNHAKLTGDKEWLESNWDKIEMAFSYIDTMRARTSVHKNAPNFGLIPAGNSDGGLWGLYPEYTNIYWTLSGMKAAVESARWLGKMEAAEKWEKEYNQFYKLFRKAASRDMKTDAFGNAYLPIRMVENDDILPQKAQWAFLHAVYPGKLFEENDPIVEGNMKMLKAVEKEGLTYNTGWHNDGVWNYFGSFFGHALLWTGHGDLAAKKLYAMANHASPLLVWREENGIKESPIYPPIGDMPHNWASAEFIRLVRHLIALERGNELHLFEGLPEEWCQIGMKTALNRIETDFGVLSLSLTISEDGNTANLFVDMEEHTDAVLSRIVIHTMGINGEDEELLFKPEFPLNRVIRTKF